MASTLSSLSVSTSGRRLSSTLSLRRNVPIACCKVHISTKCLAEPMGLLSPSESPHSTVPSYGSLPSSSFQTACSSNSLLSPRLHPKNQTLRSPTIRKFQTSSIIKKTQHEEEMKDEYGEMNDDGESFVVANFTLENSSVLPRAELRYQCYGELNEAKDNVIVVCHALTGNASLHSWWGGLLGHGKAFDTSKYFIVCCNILGSCYGSTNPQSINPESNLPYGKDFPDVSVRDTVKLQLRLVKEAIGASSIKCVIGGSFGGMQTMEFAVQGGIAGGEFVADNGSPFVRSVIPIACGASHTAWQIAISEVQRQSIYADPKWDSNPFKATKGLEVARQMGMISYRTANGYRSKFGREIRNNDRNARYDYGSDALWQVKSYLEYQGVKFIDRFDPITYVKLTEQMDSHDVSRNRAASVREVLGRVEIPACVMGIDSDILYPLSEQEEIVEFMPNADYKIIHSDEGHDGFLLEQSQVNAYITEFLSAQNS